MISILIPIYNQNAVGLVKGLQSQCEKLGIQFQILVFDDLSKEEFREQNRPLGHLFGVSYLELSENLGRAKIRNRLARTARFKHLLFIDGDSEIIRDDYIQSYLDHIDQAEIVYGGREYQKEKPSDRKKVLHWKYGVKREALPLEKRVMDPYLNFQSNNFMITAGLFEKLKFDENVKGYGYEDLLFAQKIKDVEARILHIDNPVLHAGLEDADAFIEKTKNACKNLALLNKSGQLEETRLTRFYEKMKALGLKGIMVKYYRSNSAAIHRNLTSANPSIGKFNLMKFAEYDGQLI